MRALAVAYLIKHPLSDERIHPELHRARALQAALARRGHTVHLVPGYSAQARDKLAPSRRRLLDIATEFRGAVRRYRQGVVGKDVVVLAMTGPLSSAAAWRALRGIDRPLVLHVADVPSLFEIEMAGGGVGARLRWEGVRRIERRLYRRADHIVVVSPRFRREIARSGIEAGKVSVITNGVDRGVLPGIHRARRSGFTAIYAGNMYDAAGLDLLLDVARVIEGHPITIQLVGNGLRRAPLERRAREDKLTCLTFADSLPLQETARLVADADVALVPLCDGLVSPLPSKVFLPIVVGTPLVGIGPLDSALAEFVALTGSGVMLPRDPALVARTLRELAAAPQALERLRETEARWAGVFDGDSLYGRLAEIVESLADGRRVEPVDVLQAPPVATL